MTRLTKELIDYLKENKNKVCSREDIAKYVFDYTDYNSGVQRTIDQHIAFARKEIDGIETVHGVGYMYAELM